MNDFKLVMESVDKDSMYLHILFVTKNQDVLEKLYFDLLTATKPLAFQSVAMQLGLTNNLYGQEAFAYGTDVLMQCKEIGLFEIRKGRGLSIKSMYRVEDEIAAQLGHVNYEWLNPSKKHQGMPVILGKDNNHTEAQAIDVLNILQEVEFDIDVDILTNFNDVSTFETEQFGQIVSRLVGQAFRFEWLFDKRGRSYSTGYDINLQGNEFKKALLNLHHKELVI